MKQRELELLLQQFVDGRLDDDTSREVLALLKSDPEAFHSFCEYAELDAGLRHLTTGPALLGTEQSAITELAREERLKRTRLTAVLTAAAALLLAATVLYLIWVPEPDPVLTYRTGPDTLLEIAHSGDERATPEPGTLAVGSRLILRQGNVECSFESGVRAVIQAPADLTVSDDNALHLADGVAWFHVPAPAVGFQVETPELLITDLGTEFGVVSHSDENDEVHVFSGKVDVLARSGVGGTVLLTTNTARVASSDGGLTAIPLRNDRFLRTLPLAPPAHLHWTFDEGDPGRQLVKDNRPSATRIKSECASPDGTEPFASFTSVSGRFGNALCSLGRNGFVQTNWTGIDPTFPCTVAYWIKLPPGQHYVHSMVGWNSQAGANSGALFSSVRNIGSGCVAGVSFGDSDFDGTTPIDDGQWHHLAIVTNGRMQSNAAPDFICYVDGRREPMTPRRRDDGPTGFPGQTTNPEAVPLTLFARSWDQEKLGQDVTLALVRENGITSAYLNGRKIGANSGFPPGLDELTTLMIGANRHSSGELEGFFTGTIDRVRLSTFTGPLGSNGLLDSEPPNLTVVADYTFDDHQTPAGFREIGNPTYADGRLMLDGDDALELNQTPLTAADNFVMETTVSMTSFPSNPRKFAFPVSNGNGRNCGWGLLYQYTWGGMVMSHSPVGSASATHGQEVAVSIDELHIFEEVLSEDQVANLHRFNDHKPRTR